MAETEHLHVWGNAAAYEAYIGRWSRPVARVFLAWLALPPRLSWLDVGCGTGALTQAILDVADPREVFGVDPSADFIAAAAARIADPRVRFAVGDARSLPAPDAAYDAVIAGLVLHFVPDPLPAIREMARAARSGGTVAAYVWDAGVLLVDDKVGQASPGVRAAVAAVTSKPIRFVVNTHWHRDHSGGNEALAGEGAVIVAHENARRHMSVETFIAVFDRRIPASPVAHASTRSGLARCASSRRRWRSRRSSSCSRCSSPSMR